MRRYVLVQIALFVPTLLGALTFAFVLVRLIPGDPAAVILGDTATAEALASLRTQLGLDQPLPVQYLTFLGHLLQGDLGRSTLSRAPVLETIASQMPSTMLLAGTSLVVGAAIGLPLGIVAAVRRGTKVDHSAMIVAMLGVTMPSFWLALLLILLFSALLGWLPAIGIGDGTPIGTARSLILPTATLGLLLAGTLARITRTSMLEVLGDDYVRTAHAKGLRQRTVLIRHALGNAALPIVTVIGLQLGHLLSGAVLVEATFARPGLGTLMVQGVFNRDYPTVQGCIIVFACLFVGVNFVVDILYGFIDPRIRY